MTADRVPLDEAALRADVLGVSAVWRQLDVVAETRSTNADLLARAASQDVDGAVLLAEHQTAGRGRQGRSWSAAPHAQITMSVAVDTGSVPSRAWGWLPLATGLAVVDAVSELGVDAHLKWPNDVLAGGGKLAGILAEVAQRVVVIGVGLNVSVRGAEIGIPEAISLTELGVGSPDRQRIVGRVLAHLGNRIDAWRTAHGADERLLGDYRARSSTLGQQVRAVLPGGNEVVGTAQDIDDGGRLVIVADDRTVTVAAGDIVHLRPAGESS
ncbi:biotin--[acetyl-CoA-carboxylase] ligase [Mycobacterium deserti]|uniref:biotin--[biotin carboxyl-carrier protein] ligase n=1 Tax=Mycobacterium deserti TaxID=2978347 RepID=A0ABT2MF63_9MYCO|nr:biotin--[acetyl-CoA-carboxylase] ligase [Mycobacterium deserti]MCT7660903.1 biotin--[acetyl-CoA-carboxylase] ligase [Mycobacterium deserti]